MSTEIAYFQKFAHDARSEGGPVRKNSKKKFKKIVQWSYPKKVSGEGVLSFLKDFPILSELSDEII